MGAVLATGLILLLILADRAILLVWPTLIERYVTIKTPFRTHEHEVLDWLRTQGAAATVHHVPFEAGEYPLSRTGGQAFIHDNIGYYYLPFRTDVEIFYSFDSAHRVIDISVRKSVDSL